jgi:hypothetical protein
MKGPDQSPSRIVYSSLDLKTWLKRPPTVEQARPGQCPVCQAAGRPLGEPLGLWGHGVRMRQQRGPLSPQGPPQTVVIAALRYRCQRCGAVLTVVPLGVVPRRHYAASAIALTMALWGLLMLPVAQVRQRVSPWQVVGASAARGWAMPGRWAAAISRGELFGQVRKSPAQFTRRQVAARAATTLCALAPPSCAAEPLEIQAFLAGVTMA